MHLSKAGQPVYKPDDRFINRRPVYKPVKFSIGSQHYIPNQCNSAQTHLGAFGDLSLLLLGARVSQ